ncbi:unnamed protein product [Trichogramma brassicae]|uniref:Uncharacterized protein n=1 Tax=Trichogramma brassicae TaxID=86971 RepID=A0A6H5I4D9_9HYME|nr:unnamed protein product [Trichogramma brassicae]
MTRGITSYVTTPNTHVLFFYDRKKSVHSKWVKVKKVREASDMRSYSSNDLLPTADAHGAPRARASKRALCARSRIPPPVPAVVAVEMDGHTPAMESTAKTVSVPVTINE